MFIIIIISSQLQEAWGLVIKAVFVFVYFSFSLLQGKCSRVIFYSLYNKT